MNSVVQDWVAKNCSFKQQTVLLSALRGCDTVEKNDVSKLFIRKYRSAVLKDASPGGGDFMKDEITREIITEFTKSLDKYPIHFILHFTHAVEIVGFKHQDLMIGHWWYRLYLDLVNAFHMNPETEEECDKRLADGVETICHKT